MKNKCMLNYLLLVKILWSGTNCTDGFVAHVGLRPDKQSVDKCSLRVFWGGHRQQALTFSWLVQAVLWI